MTDSLLQLNNFMKQSAGGRHITLKIGMTLKSGYKKKVTPPHLLTALTYHRDYFPNEKSGLNEVERLSLQELLQKGTCTFSELFQHISSKRENDGLSDFHFAAILNELMKGKHPLLQSDGPLPNYNHPEPNAKLNITTDGLNVLNGTQSRIDLVGIDWWIGGVHVLA